MFRRFFIEKKKIIKNRAILDGSEARHIGKVLRLGIGDTLYLLDEKGSEYHGVINSLGSKSVEVELLKKIPPRKQSPVNVVLGQALPKAQKMDYIVQKATELGVSKIIPFFSARSIPKLDDERLQKRCARWQKIALEATKQCGRVHIPRVETVVPFQEILNKCCNNSLKIMLWEDEKNNTLKEVLQSNQPSKRIVALVGPEGGFTADEVNMSRQAGFTSVSLGRYVLRTETAALCLLGILEYEWGEPGRIDLTTDLSG